MKRLFWCAVFMLALSGTALSEGIQTVLADGDPFYAERYGNAIPASESRAFEIGYRVCSVPEQPEKGDSIQYDVHVVQYDLVLVNKTGKALRNVRFTAHFKDALQIVLTSPEWYNEMVNLGASQEEGLPVGAAYSWNPFVILEDLGMLGAIELEDFYDMLIEVAWEGGEEVIRLDQESVFLPEGAVASLEAYEPLDREEVEAMLEAGIAILEAAENE